ncbi:helix-turn-helix domain-containing protein [Rhizobium leguminosarum]|uniref:helix-turn-helix domain-containing protein n=1 Tax=Rhizobium leguminosarum TaxID=384 RepID=UPI001A048597|nr:helix-turn-helix domain-containing protein [Rhizobium leguminosarum bv. viciae]
MNSTRPQPTSGARSAVPRYVCEEERLMEERAHEALTVMDIGRATRYLTRSLSEGFRRFRGIRPRDYLTARRLDGLRKALEDAPPWQTASSIAERRGYVNLTAMSAAYRQHFGETPYQKLRNRRGRM